ncbi:MAG TPA: ergothioneine biosynthesis protein EgtB [Frankiaceae bacterium]|nr:ergothioneine biosynthesis protein EgtB [Frankiaceae bacterium]
MALTDPSPTRPAPGEPDSPDAVRALLAAELERVRRRSESLTIDVLDEPELLAQHSKLMSPLVWDYAHVGNYEELWLLREAAGGAPMRPEIDSIYDAFEHPRSTRPTLPLLRREDARGYLRTVRAKVLDSLETISLTPDRPLTADAFVHRMVVQHEHMHDETMLATHQLRRGTPVLEDLAPPPAQVVPPATEVLVPSGDFTFGTSTDPWAYDNERPAHAVGVAAFFIDVHPVTNGAYRRFVDDGGYDEPRWWSDAGWDWRCRSGKRTPAFWFRDGGQNSWFRRRFGREEPLPAEQPVQHVCFYEADAYARWAGRRLPTEAEWEKAASWDPATGTKYRYPWGDQAPGPGHANLGQRHLQPAPVGAYPAGASPVGAQQMLGDVWEWTSTTFSGHPGFCVFPYREYSEVFFGDEYRVLRGGSWATDAVACRNTFRNWDYPIRRQIFAGFRTARDA